VYKQKILLGIFLTLPIFCFNL